MKILETIFDVTYLVLVITLGIIMIRKSGNSKQHRMFGIMAVVLGSGDAFHLVARVYSMWTTGMAANAAFLGFGQFVTSITMTIFYVILYHIWQMRYAVKTSKKMTIIIYVLAALRIALCFAPQNQWLVADAPLSWSIYRNIPFAIMGVLIIILFYYKTRESKEYKDTNFKFMWLAIALSFAFYVPVVLFAGIFPPVGALMIPKTCAYVWIVYMGFKDLKSPSLA